MADFEYNKANLGAATLSSAITSSQTSITVDASDASTFPNTPFYATISPIGETPNFLNAEIVKVTAISSGTLTVARGQRSTTAKAFAAGSVIFNGVYTQDLDYAQAVGRAFFTASYSAGVFYINNAMLPTTPTDGMSIRVIFSQNVTAGAVGVSLNNGTTYNVYAGAAITSSHGSATTNPQVKSGIIYELVFYNGAWYVMNLPANNSITSDNVDWATFPRIVATGEIKTTTISGSVLTGLGINNGQTIYDSNYASTSGEDILLQPGTYLVNGRVRWSDYTTNTNNFFGIRVGSSNTDDVRYGNWGFTNQRLSQEANAIFTLTTATKIRTVVFTASAHSVSEGAITVIRLPDIQ